MSQKFMDQGNGRNPIPPEHPDDAYYFNKFIEDHALVPYSYSGSNPLPGAKTYMGVLEGSPALFTTFKTYWTFVKCQGTPDEDLDALAEQSFLGLKLIDDKRTGALDTRLAQMHEDIKKAFHNG